MKNALISEIEYEKQDCKEKLEKAEKKDKKHIQTMSDQYISILEKDIKVLDEAQWLTEKFGDGKYKDILGLCKIATRADIKAKNYSLTPGAYVGVAEVEDDGVDFNERMKEIHKELIELQTESNELMNSISKRLEALGL